MIEASADDTMFHHVITGVEKPGIYEVTVASRVDDFVGPESGRSTFTITESMQTFTVVFDIDDHYLFLPDQVMLFPCFPWCWVQWEGWCL